MIARIVIPLLLVIVLSDVYIDAHYFRKRVHITWQQRRGSTPIFSCLGRSQDQKPSSESAQSPGQSYAKPLSEHAGTTAITWVWRLE